VFYAKLTDVLAGAAFDAFVEERCGTTRMAEVPSSL